MRKKQSPPFVTSWAKQSEKLTYRKMMKANDHVLSKKWNEFYKHLILDDREVDIKSKEIILLCLLTGLQEKNGRIHIKRALETGVSKDQVLASISLAGIFESFRFYEFASQNWSQEIAIDNIFTPYVKNIEFYSKIVSPKLIEIMGIVCHAAKRNPTGMEFHLVRAFSLGAQREEIAEAMSYLIMLCSIPTLNDAVENWIILANQGQCPSPYPL